jgi:NADPH2:quinone reductase
VLSGGFGRSGNTAVCWRIAVAPSCSSAAASGALRPAGTGIRSAASATACSACGRWAVLPVPRRTPVSAQESVELVRAVLAEAAAGRIRPVVGQEFGLGDAAVAHAAIEARETVGKTLLATRLL